MLSRLFNLPWPPEFFFPLCPCCVVVDADTPWCVGVRLFLQSGQFSSTIKTSQEVNTLTSFGATDISWDGIDTPWGGRKAGAPSFEIFSKLFLQSGQFSSTVKTSQDVSNHPIGLDGFSWDGTNVPTIYGLNLALFSGKFSATIKTSLSISSYGLDDETGISWDGTNTPWCGVESLVRSKLFLQSGQFSSTQKTSQDVILEDNNIRAISWDDTNTLCCGAQNDDLYLFSGQFTSVVKTTQSVSGDPQGINTNKRTTG